MEKTVLPEGVNKTNAVLAIAALGVAVLMGIAVYGFDSAIPGVHDLFHDFRHSIGISCH
ncbi:MAG: CbtB-domain containing protein [Nitrospinae bacterium]|nr:CbtB-domain containing protein [Nitrospinota bacterium]